MSALFVSSSEQTSVPIQIIFWLLAYKAAQQWACLSLIVLLPVAGIWHTLFVAQDSEGHQFSQFDFFKI